MDDIDWIRARAVAATGGPWRRHGADVWVDDSSVPLFTGRDGDASAREQADRDAEFVAHARDDVLTLLAALADDAPSAGRHGQPD
ncbi:hypothetical protein ACXR2U_06405 [Jatrophihabitans sp. YIM 134969]